jgi:hypothetical protein
MRDILLFAPATTKGKKEKAVMPPLMGTMLSSLFVHDHKQNLLHDGGVFTLAMKRIRIQKEENYYKIMIASFCVLLCWKYVSMSMNNISAWE